MCQLLYALAASMDLLPDTVCLQVNDFRSRGKQLSATEAIFVTATMEFRKNILAMYSLTVSSHALTLSLTHTPNTSFVFYILLVTL